MRNSLDLREKRDERDDLQATAEVRKAKGLGSKVRTFQPSSRACRARRASLAPDPCASAVDRDCSGNTKACLNIKGRPPSDIIPQNANSRLDSGCLQDI